MTIVRSGNVVTEIQMVDPRGLFLSCRYPVSDVTFCSEVIAHSAHSALISLDAGGSFAPAAPLRRLLLRACIANYGSMNHAVAKSVRRRALWLHWCTE